MATVRGTVRITLRPGDRRRVFIVASSSGAKPRIGIQSLAQHIWTSKKHLGAIKDASRICGDRDFRIERSSLCTNASAIACIEIDRCVDWLLKHSHKSSVAQKRLKEFIADEWDLIKAIPARVLANKANAAVIMATDRLYSAVLEGTNPLWKAKNTEFISHLNALKDETQSMTVDDDVYVCF